MKLTIADKQVAAMGIYKYISISFIHWGKCIRFFPVFYRNSTSGGRKEENLLVEKKYIFYGKVVIQILTKMVPYLKKICTVTESKKVR